MVRCVVPLLAGIFAAQSFTGDSHVLIVSGIGGQAQYSEAFYRWGASMFDAAKERLGLPAANVVYLSERPERDPERIHARSTKDNVEKAFDDLARRVAPNDRILILLIGHGSGSGAESRFNLPGPDISATELAAQLDKFPTQTVVLVNTASASGDFVPVLSGRNRVLVTATKTGFERNETVFGEFFVEAFASDGADTDKDNRVSILEAFTYARREVTRRYEDSNRLLTEHALLDDNGDGEGSTDLEEGLDGALAGTLFLAASPPAVAAMSTDDPVLKALYEEKAALGQRIEELQAIKDQMERERYEATLEDLLVELALKNHPLIEAASTSLDLAYAKRVQASHARYLPRFTLRQVVGPIPRARGIITPDGGVISPDTSFRLSDLRVFTQVDLDIIQP
ncbi:MAG: hypothetical protein IH798_04910, partial [Gemmatimonadetes bacterium]|nr:hypothetical protein [Gemmatimonadota bacterium]